MAVDQRYRDHVFGLLRELAKKQGLRPGWISLPTIRGSSLRIEWIDRTAIANITEPVGSISYMVALHELGHLATLPMRTARWFPWVRRKRMEWMGVRDPQSLARRRWEIAAWDWAEKHNRYAPERVVKRLRRASLQTYGVEEGE